MMDRALTPPGGGDSEAGKKILRQLYQKGLADFENSMNEQRDET